MTGTRDFLLWCSLVRSNDTFVWSFQLKYSCRHEEYILSDFWFTWSILGFRVPKLFNPLQEDGTELASEPTVIMTGNPEGQENVNLSLPETMSLASKGGRQMF